MILFSTDASRHGVVEQGIFRGCQHMNPLTLSNNLLAPRQKYVGAGGSTAPFSAAAFLFPLAAMVAYGL
ncbi:hypothetical protein HBH89_253020 [Parastagonospora nodorum]|nr:hypothetical protein HBH89_253020 [Parastagonospora nodorum]